MTRTHIAALIVLVVAIPAATAGSYFSSNDKPCFIAGAAGYRISDRQLHGPHRQHGGAAELAHAVGGQFRSGRFRAGRRQRCRQYLHRRHRHQEHPSRSRSRQRRPHGEPVARARRLQNIYVRSASFSQQDADALFAVTWQTARKTADSGREFAARS